MNKKHSDVFEIFPDFWFCCTTECKIVWGCYLILKTFAKKVNFKVYRIKRLLFLPQKTRILFFKAFILPHSDYCNSWFVYFTHSLISRLESLFNSTVFKMFNKDLKVLTLDEQYRVLSELNILPYRYRLFFRISTFSYKMINDTYLDMFKLACVILQIKSCGHRGLPACQ